MSDATTPPGAIQLLTTDHGEVEAMFRQIESLSEGEVRDQIVQDVIRDLSVHAAIEEQVLYPVLRKELPDGETLVQKAIDEHQHVKETLAAIEGADTPIQRNQVLVRLMGDVRHHVEEEEIELFPKLQASVSRAELQEMGGKLAAAKKIAPTHPHPNAPNSPPGNLVGGVAAAVMDKRATPWGGTEAPVADKEEPVLAGAGGDDLSAGTSVSGVGGEALQDEDAGLRPVSEQGARIGWGKQARETEEQAVAENDGTGQSEKQSD